MRSSKSVCLCLNMMSKFIKNIDKDKKGQQEIVGFILIVVIMVVIGVIFLGISLRNTNGGIIQEDVELTNFLSASMKYTTDCVLREPFYSELSDVAEGCYSNRVCSDSRTACEVLNQTYRSMIEKLWIVGSDRPLKYVSINIFYQSDIENIETKQPDFFFTESGNESLCSVKRAGRFFGGMIVEMNVCKNE